MELLHGGDWAGFSEDYGRMPLDFSSNTSPLGLPEGVRQAILASLEGLTRYPDPLCRALRTALSKKYALPMERIVCGNGAADLLYRIPLAFHPERALLAVPTFLEYEEVLRKNGCVCQHFPLRQENGFALSEEFLSYLLPGLDLCILCEPNNPTGITTARPLLLRILQKCSQNGTILLLDECFSDLLDAPDAHSLVPELLSHPCLMILKAFTKSYGLPGLRLGFMLCGSREMAERLALSSQPWPVSALAQSAGIAALKEESYLAGFRRLVQAQRPYLAEGLAALGCRVIPGEANYLLFYHGDGQLFEKIRKRGILLRDCRNYPGLSAGWYRAAVRTEAENQQFLQGLAACVA